MYVYFAYIYMYNIIVPLELVDPFGIQSVFCRPCKKHLQIKMSKPNTYQHIILSVEHSQPVFNFWENPAAWFDQAKQAQRTCSTAGEVKLKSEWSRHYFQIIVELQVKDHTTLLTLRMISPGNSQTMSNNGASDCFPMHPHMHTIIILSYQVHAYNLCIPCHFPEMYALKPKSFHICMLKSMKAHSATQAATH